MQKVLHAFYFVVVWSSQKLFAILPFSFGLLFFCFFLLFLQQDLTTSYMTFYYKALTNYFGLGCIYPNKEQCLPLHQAPFHLQKGESFYLNFCSNNRVNFSPYNHYHFTHYCTNNRVGSKQHLQKGRCLRQLLCQQQSWKSHPNTNTTPTSVPTTEWYLNYVTTSAYTVLPTKSV